MVKVFEYYSNFFDHDIDLEHSDEVWDFSFSPDGEFLAVGYGETNVQLWKFSESRKEKLKSVQG
jgi:WD40 repeat protein